jgi:hypothetical protein
VRFDREVPRQVFDGPAGSVRGKTRGSLRGVVALTLREDRRGP